MAVPSSAVRAVPFSVVRACSALNFIVTCFQRADDIVEITLTIIFPASGGDDTTPSGVTDPFPAESWKMTL